MTLPRIWTDAEAEYIKAHYAEQTAGKIAQALGITVGQVYSKAATLNLTKANPRIKAKGARIHIQQCEGYRVITHTQHD